MKNFRKRFFLSLIFFTLIFSLLLISSESANSIELKKGKNNVSLNLSSSVYVSSLIQLNPDIEAISYREGNRTWGYVNVFRGIGENFLIYDREYEIIASKDISLVLPK